MPKKKKQRKNVSAPINNFRNLRNRIFHNEPICWNIYKLAEIHNQLVEVMGWINRDLPAWVEKIDHFNNVSEKIMNQLFAKNN